MADSGWTSVTTSLKSEAMRKKNLSAKACYFFRVKPNMVKEEERADYTMSLPSASASLAQLSRQVAALVGGAGATLINGRGDRISAASLAGKVVAGLAANYSPLCGGWLYDALHATPR